MLPEDTKKEDTQIVKEFDAALKEELNHRDDTVATEVPPITGVSAIPTPGIEVVKEAVKRTEVNQWYDQVMHAKKCLDSGNFTHCEQILNKLAKDLLAKDARFSIPDEKDLPNTAG